MWSLQQHMTRPGEDKGLFERLLSSNDLTNKLWGFYLRMRLNPIK